MWSIPLLAEEGWLRHRLKVAKPPKKRRRRARSASAIARSRNSGQTGEIFRPEQFRRTDHPGRAVSERIHFYVWRRHPSSQRRGMRHIQHFFNSFTLSMTADDFAGLNTVGGHRPPLQSSVLN